MLVAHEVEVIRSPVSLITTFTVILACGNCVRSIQIAGTKQINFVIIKQILRVKMYCW